MDCPGQYDQFLQVLTDARKQGWKPGKVWVVCGACLWLWVLAWLSVCLLAGTDIPEDQCTTARLAPSDEAVHRVP